VQAAGAASRRPGSLIVGWDGRKPMHAGVHGLRQAEVQERAERKNMDAGRRTSAWLLRDDLLPAFGMIGFRLDQARVAAAAANVDVSVTFGRDRAPTSSPAWVAWLSRRRRSLTSSRAVGD